MKELYHQAVKKTGENREEWRNSSLDKKTPSDAKTALQDLLSVMPDAPSDWMETIFGEYEDYYKDNDIIKSMIEKKKSTIH